MSTIYLTPAETKVFEALDAEKKQGYTVETETLTYEDSPKRQKIRFSFLNVIDPELVRLKNEALAATSDEVFLELARSIDIRKMEESQMADVFFALGPTVIGLLLAEILSQAKAKDDVDCVADLSSMRHVMLESLTSALS